MGDTGVQDIGMYGTVLWGAWGPDNLACFVFNESPRQEPGSKMAFTNLWRSVAAQEEGGGRGSRWYFSAAYFFNLLSVVDFWSVVFHVFGLTIGLLCAGYKLCVPNTFHTFSTCKPLWNHGNALMYGRGYGGIVLRILFLIQIAFGFSFRANNSWTRWKGKLF